MAYSVSQDFKTAIKDQTAQKSCLILFDDLFFTTSDYTDSGVVFSQFFNTSEDLTFGDCPSDTLSFSVVSNGALAGYSFGKCRAFLGVQTDSQPYAFGSINAHIEVGGYTWTASDSGLYCDGSLIDSDEYVSLISDGTYVYAVGLTSSYCANIDGSDGSAFTPNRFMAQKLRSGLSAVFSSNTAYVWDGTNVYTYEYVPMGVYNVTKPRSTVGDVVTVQDAYDNMSLFDRDASAFLSGLTYPKTLSQIYTALCDFVGVSYASSTFTYSTTSYALSPFSDTSCSCRDILWWIAERARRVAHFNRNGVLELMSFGTVEERLHASDIGQDGYSIAEYLTPAVTGVLLKGTNGSSLTFGTMDTPYVISANPFISTITASDLNGYWAIPRYVPMELNVLEADPSVDVGDIVSIKPMVDEVVLLANVYDEIYVNNSQEAYALNAPEYSIPLMERTVTFIGGIRAKYVATGNEVREADISNTEYNASVSAKIAEENIDKEFTQQEVFNRLTNNGQAQGIFLDSNGDLYFNGTYIQAHTVAVDKLTGTIHDSGETWEIDLTNGTMTIGKVYASNISVTDLSAIGATIGGFDIDSTSIHTHGVAITSNASGSVGLSSSVFQRTIGGTSRSNLKFALGDNFAVGQDGTLYASSAVITGGSINIETDASLVDQIKLAYDVDMGSLRMYGNSSLGNTQISFNKNTVAGGVTTSFTGTLSGSALDFSYGGSTESFSIGYASPGGWGITFRDSNGNFMTIRPVVVSTW